MSKQVNTVVLDSALDKVATATKVIIAEGEPTDRASALSNELASASLTSGDFSKGSGSPTGRALTIASKSGLSITATGDATHVCLIDATNMLIATTVTSQTLTSGNTVTIPSWKFTVTQPTT